MYGQESGSNSVVDRKAQYITGGGVGVNNSSTTASKDTEGLMGDHKNGFGLAGCDIKHTRNGPSGTNDGRNLLTDSSRTPQTLLLSAISCRTFIQKTYRPQPQVKRAQFRKGNLVTRVLRQCSARAPTEQALV